MWKKYTNKQNTVRWTTSTWSYLERNKKDVHTCMYAEIHMYTKKNEAKHLPQNCLKFSNFCRTHVAYWCTYTTPKFLHTRACPIENDIVEETLKESYFLMLPLSMKHFVVSPGLFRRCISHVQWIYSKGWTVQASWLLWWWTFRA